MNKDEIICNCIQITAKEIFEAIGSGASTLASLQESTGVATGCGRCTTRIKTILETKE